MRRVPILLTLIVGVASIAPGTAEALGDPAGPLLSSHTLTGGGYHSARFTVPNASTAVTQRIVTDSIKDAQTYGYGGFILNGDGSFRSFWALTTFFPGATAHAEAPVVEVAVDEAMALDRSVFANTLGAQSTITLPAGEFIAVMAASSDDALDITMGFYGGPGVTVISTASGSNGFVLREPDFRGDVNVTAGASIAHAKVIVNASTQHDAEGRLFGWFQAPSDGPVPSVAMGYDGPAGSEDGRLSYIFANDPPGPYRFRLDHAATLQFIFVWGVDVTLPAVA
jgi:hypothetical protein